MLVRVTSWIVFVSGQKQRSTKSPELNTKLFNTEIDFGGKADQDLALRCICNLKRVNQAETLVTSALSPYREENQELVRLITDSSKS